MIIINGIRSIVFNVLFYTWTVLTLIGLSLTKFAKDYGPIRRGLTIWSKGSVIMARGIMGIKFEIRGEEKLPKEGAMILAAKHSSNVDPALAFLMRPDVTALAKKELFDMPLMGTVLRTMGVISVDRGKGTAHKSIDTVKKFVVDEQRPLIIYPEGTRVPIGERRRLKAGAFFIQADHDIPVYTVASNAGCYWRKGFWHKPGTIVFEMHEAMPRSLSRHEFMEELTERVVARSDELMREKGYDHLPALEDMPTRGKGKH